MPRVLIRFSHSCEPGSPRAGDFQKACLELFELDLFLERRVSDIAKATVSNSNQVAQKVADFANYAAISFIDTY